MKLFSYILCVLIAAFTCAAGDMTATTFDVRPKVPYHSLNALTNLLDGLQPSNSLPIFTNTVNYGADYADITNPLHFRIQNYGQNLNNPFRNLYGWTQHGCGGVGGDHRKNGTLITRRVFVTSTHHTINQAVESIGDTNCIVGEWYDFIGHEDGQHVAVQSIQTIEVGADDGTPIDQLYVLLPELPSWVETPIIATPEFVTAYGYPLPGPTFKKIATSRNDPAFPEHLCRVEWIPTNASANMLVPNAAYSAGVPLFPDWYIGTCGGDSGSQSYYLISDTLALHLVGYSYPWGNSPLSYSNIVRNIGILYTNAGLVLTEADYPVLLSTNAWR